MHAGHRRKVLFVDPRSSVAAVPIVGACAGTRPRFRHGANDKGHVHTQSRLDTRVQIACVEK